MKPVVIANGRQIEAKVPCTIKEFLVAQNILPRSVVRVNVVLAVAKA